MGPDPPRRPPDLRPLVTRTNGSVTEGIYGLVLALSMIAVSWYSGPTDAGWLALSVLVMQLLAKDPAVRPESAKSVAERLQKINSAGAGRAPSP